MKDLLDKAADLDVTNCDREPIHIPASVQPHGVMVVMQGPDLKIIQVSRNIEEVIGYAPEELLDQPLSVLLNEGDVQAVQQCLAEDFENVNPLTLTVERLKLEVEFDGIVHRRDSVVILELEPRAREGEPDFFDFYHQVKGPIARIQKAASLLEMSQVAVREIRCLTGFDRVMVYQFEEDGAGVVIAEDTDQENPYLNLHYPHTDIPNQARRLYTMNWLRLIPNAQYQPVGLIPEHNPQTGQPLDLSMAVLRSVSPLHLEYLQNMGVTASMSISLLRNQQLWGLIACHHGSPKYIPYHIRTICEFMGQVMSAELVNKTNIQDSNHKQHLKALQTRFVEELSQADYFLDGMEKLRPLLLELVSSTGAVICSEERCIQIGTTPTEKEIHILLEWIKPHFNQGIFETRSISKQYAAAETFKEIASGVLALEISRIHHNYILWFRPEVIQTVNWGGNPHKPAEVLADGTVRMSPRKSFECWQEQVNGTSLPWDPYEIEAVAELRNLIVGIVLRQVEEMSSMNFELQRSNEELDSFAYIASHDLKEPLRGIHNYANFLMEDYAKILDSSGVTKLETLVKLTQRMEDLINSLLHFSRLGRADLQHQSVDLNDLVQQVIATLTMARPDPNIEFIIPNLLPVVDCDLNQMNELFTNLISNAIKYNNKSQKRVEIGYTGIEETQTEEMTGTVHNFYVRDNGIGIPQEHAEKIFQIFRRLHGRDEFGGGTGAGLTIARKVVERHGGRIWINSVSNQGATFYFTLAAQADN